MDTSWTDNFTVYIDGLDSTQHLISIFLSPTDVYMGNIVRHKLFVCKIIIILKLPATSETHLSHHIAMDILECPFHTNSYINYAKKLSL